MIFVQFAQKTVFMVSFATEENFLNLLTLAWRMEALILLSLVLNPTLFTISIWQRGKKHQSVMPGTMYGLGGFVQDREDNFVTETEVD